MKALVYSFCEHSQEQRIKKQLCTKRERAQEVDSFLGLPRPIYSQSQLYFLSHSELLLKYICFRENLTHS